MDLVSVLKEKRKKISRLATFLRWYYPDQVQRVKNFIVFSQPDTQGTPSRSLVIKLHSY